MTVLLTHLERLESESIEIMREVVHEAENPVMLYSIGKDSAVMLHLAKKAFFPSLPPFPLICRYNGSLKTCINCVIRQKTIWYGANSLPKSRSQEKKSIHLIMVHYTQICGKQKD